MMTRLTARTCFLACAVALAFGHAPALTRADIIIPVGPDFLYTVPPTFFDFGPPLGVVQLKGNPVFQNGTDTIVQRPEANATTGAEVSTLLTGLSLVGTTSLGPVAVTLDPAHLAEDVGTMSFLATSPVVPNQTQVVEGTIVDKLTLFWLATIPGIAPITGVENFTSAGTWRGILDADQNGQGLVREFKIVIDFHVDPLGQHTVSSIPEPSTWVMLVTACVMVPGYAGWRRRRT
jgi:hypothetical protein